MGPKMDSLSFRYFGLRLALVDPTDRYSRTWQPVLPCPQFDQQRVLSRFFSLLLTAAFATIMAKRKATDEELEARAESNGYRSPILPGHFSQDISPRIFAKLRHNMHLRYLSTSATSPIPCNRTLQPAEMDEGPCLCPRTPEPSRSGKVGKF